MLIGLTGAKFSGKSSVARELAAKHGFLELSFATPLKQVCNLLFGFSDEQLEDHELKEAVDPRWGFSPRYAMQRLGTNAIRENFGKDFWIKRLAHQLPAQGNVVITDVRFDNEAEFVRSNHGYVVKIARSGLAQDDHLSESGIDPSLVSCTVLNDSSVEDLAQRVYDSAVRAAHASAMTDKKFM